MQNWLRSQITAPTVLELTKVLSCALKNSYRQSINTWRRSEEVWSRMIEAFGAGRPPTTEFFPSFSSVVATLCSIWAWMTWMERKTKRLKVKTQKMSWKSPLTAGHQEHPEHRWTTVSRLSDLIKVIFSRFSMLNGRVCQWQLTLIGCSA